jgi:hypothetical protein
MLGDCSQKAFARSADLDRHYQQVHKPKSKGTGLYCDYKPCSRSQSPFYRKDHFRDHLREYHNEDLFHRNGRENVDWVLTRNVSAYSWRCTKCLIRVSIREHGFVCPSCNVLCEVERKKAREVMRRELKKAPQ